MGVLALVLIVIAAILFGFGIFVSALKFLLWVAAILALVALISWLWDTIRGKGDRTRT